MMTPKAADKLLIVNADDLGSTPGINAGIFEAHARGLVTSATLMVGWPAAAAAARELADHPRLGVGLHVVLTGGRPLSPPAAVPSLVDAEGRLPRWPEGLGNADPAEILSEVRTQLERFRQLTGRLPTHLDSHHHSHRRAAVCEALITVAKEAGGLPIRNAGDDVAPRLERAGVPAPDVFVDTFYGADATWQTLARILGTLNPGVTEVMCHPARVDEPLRLQSTYVDERTDELEVLTRPEARQLVQAESIRLVHYGELRELAR